MSRTPTSSQHGDPLSPARFEPGAVVAGRYRIGALIGRGGMGEVYRAFDQTLSQDVALKFLPAKFLAQPEHAERLLNEVRVARRVSHRNVCRVHDVGAEGDTWFISMELIEGEDLGSIVRRVGRLSGERAVSIAREICVGLAAAHAQGVLHRDLKPGNILVDRDGHAHIADFGLAAVFDAQASPPRGLGVGGVGGGTPTYLPPERLIGEQVGPAGDIFGLGLVLFEMFTGQPAIRAKDMSELLDLHQRGIGPASNIEPAIDHAVDSVIARCLRRRPDDRPASPLLVAAELPGGSLAAAAVEAGLTLTPEQVAASGASGVMRRPVALLLFVLVLAGLATGVMLSRLVDLVAFVPLDKSADVLADRSRTILRSLGYATDTPDKVYSQAFAFDYYEELLSEIAARDTSPTWWNQLRKPRPTPIDFWYRQHTRPLATDSPNRRISWSNPAPIVPGMISLRLDPGGRLRELYVVTAGSEAPELTDPSVAALSATKEAPDPNALFEAAGLKPAWFKPAASTQIPAVYCDTTVSFSGVYPDNPTQPITANMGFFKGRPVSFRISEERLESASQFKDVRPHWHHTIAAPIELLLIVISTIGAAFLVRHNMRLGQGDRDGAFRLSSGAFVVACIGFLLRANHTSDFRAEALVLQGAVFHGVFIAATLWVFYLAIEPYARKAWPEALVAWSRLMKDRWTDPLVGQSMLVGGLVGVVGLLLMQLNALSPAWFGIQPDPPLGQPDTLAETLGGGRHALGVGMAFIVDAVRFSLMQLTGIILLVILTKRRLLAFGMYAALFALVWGFDVYTSWLSWVLAVAFAALATGLVVRCGLVALAAAASTYLILTGFPILMDFTAFHFFTSLLGVGFVVALAAFGAATASGTLRKVR